MGPREGEPMNWMDMTQREFLAALASSSPTPGGGTAAAISLGQAAALSIMVCDLTLGKDKWTDGWAVAEEVQRCAIPLMSRSGDLAQHDSDAFDGVMSAYSMKKDSEDERLTRQSAIRTATVKAAEVPLDTARAASTLLAMLPDLASYGNGNAVSDVGVAGLLASASAKGALFNVEINLNGLPEHLSSPYWPEVQSLQEKIRIDARKVMDAVRARLG